MPLPDPIPGSSQVTKRQLWWIFRLLVGLAFVMAAIAVMLVARGDPQLHIHMMIATALGVSMIVLVGAGLMALAFISSSSDHDEAAASFRKVNQKE